MKTLCIGAYFPTPEQCESWLADKLSKWGYVVDTVSFEPTRVTITVVNIDGDGYSTYHIDKRNKGWRVAA
jgi:hypothetical protein